MQAPPEPPQEFRCPACGALVTADATWCGQCFASLARQEPDPEPVAARAASAPAGADPGPTAPAGEPSSGDAKWPCPACGNRNPIELDECDVCGTSFAALMRRDERPPSVEPRDAVLRSLAFPGLGHHRAGRSMDGLRRGASFALVGGMAALIAAGGLGSPTITGVFVLLVAFALALYVGSALEAQRLARGEALFLPTRQVLWAAVVVVMVSLVVLTMSVIDASRR